MRIFILLASIASLALTGCSATPVQVRVASDLPAPMSAAPQIESIDPALAESIDGLLQICEVRSFRRRALATRRLVALGPSALTALAHRAEDAESGSWRHRMLLDAMRQIQAERTDEGLRAELAASTGLRWVAAEQAARERGLLEASLGGTALAANR